LIGGIALMFMLQHFRRSTVYSIASTVAVIALSVAIAYLKIRNYQ